MKNFLFGHHIWKKETDDNKVKITVDIQVGAILVLLGIIGLIIWLIMK